MYFQSCQKIDWNTGRGFFFLERGTGVGRRLNVTIDYLSRASLSRLRYGCSVTKLAAVESWQQCSARTHSVRTETLWVHRPKTIKERQRSARKSRTEPGKDNATMVGILRVVEY